MPSMEPGLISEEHLAIMLFGLPRNRREGRRGGRFSED